MSDEKFHFEIPIENIRNERYEKTGGGVTVQRLNHSEHGLRLKMQTKQLKEVSLAQKDSDYTSDIYLQIATPENYSLKNQKLKIEELGFEILSYSKKNQSIGTARIKKEILPDLEKRLDQYIETVDNKGKTYFAPIEAISSIPPESKIKTQIDYYTDEEISIVINLFNVLSPKERLAINGVILQELKNYTNIINQRNFSNGITSISCKIKASQIQKIATEFTTIKEIKPNQLFYVESATTAESIPNELELKPVKSKSMVCIVDSGVTRKGNIFNSLVKVRKTDFLPTGSVDCSYKHGTFVASRCVFGDNIDSCLATNELTPYCNIIDIPVFGVNVWGNETYPDEFSLRVAVEEVVKEFHETIKVYNLSLGSPKAIGDFEFSELAKLIDFLSKRYKVLFVIAAGNIDNRLGNFPREHFDNSNSRIGCPAESLLGLTVGSIAKYSNPTSLSDLNYLSPFSRIGPGADSGVKPEVVAHGGNLISPYTKTPRVSTYGFSHDGNNLAVDVGTSHSAPLISQYAQKLFDSYPVSDPNLVKALICHFSENREIHNELTGSHIQYLGFGEPIIEDAISANSYNAAYIYEGLLDQENYQFIKFHVPDSLKAENTETSLTVKITIVYDPPVNPDNETEYSNSRISAKLFKPTNDEMKGITVCGDSNYNLPWNPIIQFQQSFKRSYLTGEWWLRLRLYTRGNVSTDYMQDYSVVIEIIDDLKGTSVYDDIEQYYGDIYKRIEIKEAI